jgi:hypothetical protein
MDAHARALGVERVAFALPVVSYGRLDPAEWNALLEGAKEILGLALALGGAAVVWLIGGFTRGERGKLIPCPKLSLTPPPSGTRSKAIYVLLGSSYEEQCPSLLPLVTAARRGTQRRGDDVLSKAVWHRVAIQLHVPDERYNLLDTRSIGELEARLVRRAKMLLSQDLPPLRVVGTTCQVPRPWRPLAPQTVAISSHRPPASVARPQTQHARSASSGADMGQDAAEMKRKGMALLSQDRAAAERYLLAATVLASKNEYVRAALTRLIAKTYKKKPT